MDKDSIREAMRTRRHEVTEEERKTAAKAVCQNLMESTKIGLLLSCWKISTYLSTSHELPTRYIVRAFWGAGREVNVPAWNEENKAYDLCAFLPGMKVIEGPLGVREPVVRFPVPAWDVDAFIIPGLVFDMYGARLGFGAGFYDRILAGARNAARLIAVCYDWQVIEDEQVPQEPHDIRVNWIVTDKRVIKCGVPPRRRAQPDAVDE